MTSAVAYFPSFPVGPSVHKQNADQGRGQIISEICGRHMWMIPYRGLELYEKLYCAFGM